MSNAEEKSQRKKDMITSYTTQEPQQVPGSMFSPAAPQRPLSRDGNQIAFSNLITKAWPKLAESTGSRDYALDHGIDEKALEAYASGACSLYEHEEIERLVLKCEWAMTYLTDLIKSRRTAE